MTTIRLDHVTKVFPGGAVALDGVDLTIRDGELLVLFDALSGTALARHPRRRVAELGTAACVMLT